MLHKFDILGIQECTKIYYLVNVEKGVKGHGK